MDRSKETPQTGEKSTKTDRKRKFFTESGFFGTQNPQIHLIQGISNIFRPKKKKVLVIHFPLNRGIKVFFQPKNDTIAKLIHFPLTMSSFMIQMYVVFETEQFSYPIPPHWTSRWQAAFLWPILNSESLLHTNYKANLYHFCHGIHGTYLLPDKHDKAGFCWFITFLSCFSYPIPLIKQFLTAIFNFSTNLQTGIFIKSFQKNSATPLTIGDQCYMVVLDLFVLLATQAPIEIQQKHSQFVTACRRTTGDKDCTDQELLKQILKFCSHHFTWTGTAC